MLLTVLPVFLLITIVVVESIYGMPFVLGAPPMDRFDATQNCPLAEPEPDESVSADITVP
jgi:hypothetical protein